MPFSLCDYLSVLLRLWATAGEMILAGIFYAIDWKGALRGGGKRESTMTNVVSMNRDNPTGGPATSPEPAQ